MFIEIEGLEGKPLHVRHLFPINEIRFSHEDAWLETPVAVDFTLFPSGKELQVAGAIKTSVRCRCSRCTKEFILTFEDDFDLSYSQQPKWDGSAEIELKYEDMDIGYYDGVRFDVNALALERIELTMPMQYVCRDDCKGLCYKCGADLNEETCLCREEPDTRLSVLLEFKKKLITDH
ncbi:MAG: DUF177 domain-containing protein [Acidobacteria bacterium]|nr:DUF177 domain-containing protein [Acidobacteriota bacterium]